jgi:hypothetical protein
MLYERFVHGTFVTAQPRLSIILVYGLYSIQIVLLNNEQVHVAKVYCRITLDQSSPTVDMVVHIDRGLLTVFHLKVPYHSTGGKLSEQNTESSPAQVSVIALP